MKTILYLTFYFSEAGLYTALAVLELRYVNQAGLEFRDPSASAVLELKVCYHSQLKIFCFILSNFFSIRVH